MSFVIYPSKKLANNDSIHAIFDAVYAILAIISELHIKLRKLAKKISKSNSGPIYY